MVLRHATIIYSLVLMAVACSKAKEAQCPSGTDPRTGACVDPNASQISFLQDQLKNEREINRGLREDNDRLKFERQRDIINNPNANPSLLEQAKAQLGELGLKYGVKFAEKGFQKALDELDKILAPNTPPTNNTPSRQATP